MLRWDSASFLGGSPVNRKIDSNPGTLEFRRGARAFTRTLRRRFEAVPRRHADFVRDVCAARSFGLRVAGRYPEEIHVVSDPHGD